MDRVEKDSVGRQRLIHMGFLRSRKYEVHSFTSVIFFIKKGWVPRTSRENWMRLTANIAGSSWVRRGGAWTGSSTDRSFTSEARKMIYWYGS